MVKLFELFDGENTAMFASDWPHHDFDHPQFVFGLPFSRRGAAQDHGPRTRPLLLPRSAGMNVSRASMRSARSRTCLRARTASCALANRELGVFNIDGSLHAIPNLCPHQRGPLCAGAVSGTIDYGPHTDWKLAWIWDGEVVTCPWHSLEFHVPTGSA